MGILDQIPGIIASATADIMGPLTLSKPGARTPDGRGGYTAGTATDCACRGLILDYSDFARAASAGAITDKDRKALIVSRSLESGIAPAVGDTITEGASGWRVVRVVRDPAGATYEVQLRP
jgi:hypothetical protein